MQPELEHKEAENVTLVIPNMMEEEGEPEKSLSNHAGKSTFGKECIPLEKKRKHISIVGCSSSFSSLKLLKMIDEIIQTPTENTVEGYQVKEEFKPILSKIIRKHGDIAKNCVTELREIRSLLMEMICGVILEFEKKDVTEINESVLKSKLAILDGIKKMNVEVEWLIKRLAEVLEARELLMQHDMLKEKTDKNRKRIEECENALDKCKEQKKELFEKVKALCDEEVVCEGNLAKAKEESANIAREVEYAKNTLQPFLVCSVVDGLI